MGEHGPAAGVLILYSHAALQGLILMAETLRVCPFLSPETIDKTIYPPGIFTNKHDNENSNHGNQNR